MDSEIVLNADGKPVRRVRQQQQQRSQTPKPRVAEIDEKQDAPLNAKSRLRSKTNSLEEEAAILQQLQAEDLAIREQAERRECPVPKPKGVIGRLMGFNGEKTTHTGP